MTKRGATAPSSQIAWQLVELHGCWWACDGELPPPEAFQSHRRQPNRQFLGHMPLVRSRKQCCTATCLVATPKSVPRANRLWCPPAGAMVKTGFLSRQADRRRHSSMSSWRIYPH
jgi:hypothetical protein